MRRPTNRQLAALKKASENSSNLSSVNAHTTHSLVRRGWITRDWKLTETGLEMIEKYYETPKPELAFNIGICKQILCGFKAHNMDDFIDEMKIIHSREYKSAYKRYQMWLQEYE